MCIIIDINHKWDSYDFCTNLWKSNFKQNLYELTKHSYFLMYVAHDMIFASFKDQEMHFFWQNGKGIVWSPISRLNGGLWV